MNNILDLAYFHPEVELRDMEVTAASAVAKSVTKTEILTKVACHIKEHSNTNTKLGWLVYNINTPAPSVG